MKKVFTLAVTMLLVCAMVLPVCAAAVNSVRQPGAPVVSEVEKESVTVTVTPLAEQEKASWAVQQEMKAATKALNDGDLTKVSGVQEAVKALNELNAALKPGEAIVKPGASAEAVPENQKWTEVKVENLAVSEVFHVHAEETGIAVTFEAEGIRAGQFLMVMVFVDGQWKVLDFDAVEILEDGKVKIVFQQYGTVAFIVDKDEQAQYLAEQAKKK